MYYPNHIEDVCFDSKHTKEVLEEIKRNFHRYFEQYLDTEAGAKITAEKLEEIGKEIGCTITKSTKSLDKSRLFKSIIKDAINDFEKDRESYIEIMDQESLEEHEDDPPNFKNTVLKNGCPIIRQTLQNKRAKELDKYRIEFRLADPNDLLVVVSNLTSFANDYVQNVYDKGSYEDIDELKKFSFSDLDGEEYTAYGVIGGGIKSHMLYKLNPEVFPNRGREALWAFWYLTNKKVFQCKQDSEFLMVNVSKSTTQQNFFYPYELFTFYAFHVFKMLKEEAEKLSVYLDPAYRYVFVNSYLSFVAKVHGTEIDFLKSAFTEDGYGYH